MAVSRFIGRKARQVWIGFRAGFDISWHLVRTRHDEPDKRTSSLLITERSLYVKFYDVTGVTGSCTGNHKFPPMQYRYRNEWLTEGLDLFFFVTRLICWLSSSIRDENVFPREMYIFQIPSIGWMIQIIISNFLSEYKVYILSVK